MRKLFVIFISMFATTAQSAISVVDGQGLAQNTISAIESVSQTANMINQYRTQLQQYQNMLQNTRAPTQQIWSQIQSQMRSLTTAIDTLGQYERELGSIQNHLSRFQDVSSYRNQPCLTGGNCTIAQARQFVRQRNTVTTQAQKRANDANIRGLKRQQDSLVQDAQRLERIQRASQSATGQMQALGYSNQFANQIATQLLQIRSLLIAQHNMMATRMQVLSDREAREAAAKEAIYGRLEFTRSPQRAWSFPR